jgi:MoxR-like ATPase
MQLTTLSPDFYTPGSELLAAINTALFLRRPLLLSGDPGTGKTECAHFVARQLSQQQPGTFNMPRALRFDTKSVSVSTDLFYSYDAVAHFGDKTSPSRPKESFISFNSLGIALLATHPPQPAWEKFANYGEVLNKKPAIGSVILIDEIDKAPRDFPNDLLAELEKPPFKFSIKEIPGFTAVQDAALPIVVIITSNNEKGLPDAFLRRCVFHHINFPGKAELLSIVKANLQMENTYLEMAIEKFFEIRKANLAKQPATSELIDWIACLHQQELLNGQLENWGQGNSDYVKRLTGTLGIITKTRPDFETLKKKIEG